MLSEKDKQKTKELPNNIAADMQSSNQRQSHLKQQVNKERRSRQELITLLEDIVLIIVESLAKGEAPTLLIPNHRNWNNVDCSDGRVMLKAAGEVAVLRVKYHNIQSQHKFALIIYMLSIMHRLLLTGSTITKRELYYQDINIFLNQESMNAVIADACRLVQAPSWQLGVVSTSKGLIAGPLTIITSTNEEVDCNIQGGILIPQDIVNVKTLKTRAKFVLIVEKDAAFQKLLDEGILSRLGPCLLLTGKGFPDVCTRVLLWRIWQDLQLPILALVDADPHGIDIMCVYRFGSLSMSWQAQELAVPILQWIGIHPKEIQELGIPAQLMNRNELNKLRALLTRPYIMQNASLQYQIQTLLSYGKKAEIEGINSFSTSYLTDVYLPNKILCQDII